MTDIKRQLTLEEQEKIKQILKESEQLAHHIETSTNDVPDGVYFTALAILVKTASEDPKYAVAAKMVDSLSEFAKKMQLN